MSYTIEYSKHAYYFVDDRGDKYYLTYVMVADNNVYPRRPSPAIFALGLDWEIIGEACRAGASVESGCLKPGGRWLTPEGYIKRWREVLKEAKPYEQLSSTAQFELAVEKNKLETFIQTEPDKDKKYSWEKIRAISAQMERTEEKFFDDILVKFRIHPKTLADLKLYQEFEHYLKNNDLLYWRSLKYV